MHVVGTAGHVDHGKSALVEALTGTNPDRWEQERRRGMTLDLGFAHLRFGDGAEGGIVDVPGHERFLHNMLAGAAGMELLLLVVDAGEGVMPQTLEHLAILQFLDVRRIIVVASKIDLIETAQREDACRRIEQQLRGTIAAGVPILPVSALSGENIDSLRRLLHRELAEMPPRNYAAPVYLPVDRVFTLPGLGTIVTGTLMQGTIETGDALKLEPGGALAQIRSIGVFGSVRNRVEAGSRVALNLSGIDRREIARGQAVVGQEFSAAQSFAVRFTPLAGAVPLLRGRRTPVRAYIGSAEVLGTLVADEPMESGREARAALQLREPVVAFPGVRFVLRRPSPMTLLGGGYVEGAESPNAGEEESPDEAVVLGVLNDRGLDAVEATEIAVAANLREAAALRTLERLVERGDVVAVSRPRAYMSAAVASSLLVRALAQLDEAHRDEPWAMGVTSIALSRALGVPEALLVRVLGHFVEEGRLVNRSGYYAALGHRPSLSAEQRAFFDDLVTVDEGHPFLPISFAGAVAAVKLAHVTGISKAFDTMLARGALVKVGEDLYSGSQIGSIRARVEAHLNENGHMTAAGFRDLLGTSRKYAVPLLEWLDAGGVTIRNGDYRTLRKKGAPQEP
ncbi:MAG: selenocysteine-specific translation elongation factor [Candidatus Cybelea sp.]